MILRTLFLGAVLIVYFYIVHRMLARKATNTTQKILKALAWLGWIGMFPLLLSIAYAIAPCATEEWKSCTRPEDAYGTMFALFLFVPSLLFGLLAQIGFFISCKRRDLQSSRTHMS